MNDLRFVVLHHQVGPSLERTDQSHFDWMFQTGGSLRTWATSPVDQFEVAIELTGKRLPNHHAKYLDYEGELSNDRGTVTQVFAGKLQVIEDFAERFVGQLSWKDESQELAGFVVCQRINVDSDLPDEETPADWSVSFSPGWYETKR